MHRKIAGIRDEALLIRRLVQGIRFVDHTGVGDRNDWMERHLPEAPPAVRGYDHRARGPIYIVRYDNARFGAQVQIPEHMTGRQGSYE